MPAPETESEKGDESRPAAPTTDSLRDLMADIDGVYRRVKANAINRANLLRKILDSAGAEDRPALIRQIADGWDQPEPSNEVEVDDEVSVERVEVLKDKYGRIVDGLLDLAVKQKPQAEDFYAQIAASIYNPIFADDESRTFALYWIMVDDLLPYFHLDDGLRMSDADWLQLRRRYDGAAKKCKFILGQSAGRQKSETCDLLLRELDAIDDYAGRVRVMSLIVDFYRLKFEQALEMQRLSR